MAITIKCPDCGHTEESKDGASKTCPECEGTMVAPAKKKYQAKSSSLDEEERARKKNRDDDDDDEKPKKKAAARDDDDDEDEPKAKKKSSDEDEDEDEKPKSKKKRSSDDDDEKGEGYILDESAAQSLEINSGFGNKRLMKQVCEELARGETLHWAGRMCKEIAEQKARVLLYVGIGVAIVGCIFSGIFFAVAPWFAGLIPLIFVLIGVLMMIFLPGATRKAAAISWYAVTDRRAIVYAANLFGGSGSSTSYEPNELRRMRVKSAKSPKGAGDLIFKTKITETHTRYVDRRTGRTTRTEVDRHETHYGFLGIEDVREVETLIHKVLLKTVDDDEDDDDRPKKKRRDDDDDDEKPKKKAAARDDDDDEDEPKAKKKSRDDDDDDRPRKKRPRDDDDD